MTKRKTEIIDLTCPNCQSPECFEIGKDKYRCSKCKTNFICREEAPKVVNNTTIINGNSLNNAKPVLLRLTVFLIILITLPFLFFIFRPLHRTNSALPVVSAEKKKERGDVQFVLPIAAKDRVYLWYDRLIRHFEGGEFKPERIIEIIDPQTEKIVKELVIPQGKESWSSESMLVIGDKCWVSFRGGIMGVDQQSLEIVETEETLSKRHTELADGLLECTLKDHRLSNDNFICVRTKSGKNYGYAPLTDEILELDFWGHLIKDNKQVSEKRTIPFFYFCRKEQNASELVLYKIYSDNKQESFTPDRSYFNAIIRYEDAETIVISYQNDANEDGIQYLQCISAESGNIVWTYSDENLNKLMRWDSKQAIAGSGKDRQMVLCITGAHLSNKELRAMGLNLNTGKVLFKVRGEWDY